MKSKPMRSKFIRSVLGTLLPTVLGLIALLFLPVWSMEHMEVLHKRIDNEILPVRDEMQRSIDRTHRLRVDASTHVFTLDKTTALTYDRHRERWLAFVKTVHMEKLPPSVAASWQAGIADMRTWLEKYGDPSVRDGEMAQTLPGEPLFERAVNEMDDALKQMDSRQEELRAQVREWEHSALAATGGLAILGTLLVLFSWRNAVALHRALNQASRNAESLEVAVKETNHRVKNNLQTIGALIDMNRQDYGEQIPRRILDDIYQQVLTVAAVHDFLSHEHQANRVAVRPMLEKLVKLTASAKELSAKVDSEAIDLPVKEATSTALIANELVLNAGKHGAKCIHVHFTVREGQCALRVCDDGPGLPPDFSVAKHGNLGTTLIETLVQHDLGGTVRWANGPDLGGAEIVIAFPLPETDE